MKSDYQWVIDMQNFHNNENQENSNKEVELVKKKIWKKLGFSTDYNHSNVIIEEPEQNLFPETQKELIYHLFESIKVQNRQHNLVITTHSPYILYAINNCLMGNLVSNQDMDKIEKAEFLETNFLSRKSWISPKLISIWEIHNGTLKQIQDEDNILSENFFDIKMTDLTDEYYQLLNYYKNEK